MIHAHGRDGACEPLVLVLDDRQEEAFLVAELRVESRQRSAGLADDVVNARGLVALAEEDGSGGLKEGLPARDTAINRACARRIGNGLARQLLSSL